MAKYSIDDTTMTGLANSARALTGGTAGLTPSGIKSVMDTEKLNVTAALAAIAEKGVTVDSGSTSDDLAALIAAIEAGGGGVDIAGTGYTSMRAGSVIPSSNLRALDIGIDFEKSPELIIVYLKKNAESASLYQAYTDYKVGFIYAHVFCDSTGAQYTLKFGRGYSGASDVLNIAFPNFAILDPGKYGGSSSSPDIEYRQNTVTVSLKNLAGYEHHFVAGVEYGWMVFA